MQDIGRRASKGGIDPVEIEQRDGFIGEAFSSPLVNGGMLLALFGCMLAAQPMKTGISICFFLAQSLCLPWAEEMHQPPDRSPCHARCS